MLVMASDQELLESTAEMKGLRPRLCRRTVRKGSAFPKEFFLPMRLRLYLSGEAQPRLVHFQMPPERHSLSALCGGKAADQDLFQLQPLLLFNTDPEKLNR